MSGGELTTTKHAHGPATIGHGTGWARWYDLMFDMLMLGKAPAMRQMTVALAGIAPGDKVLDVGCGTRD